MVDTTCMFCKSPARYNKLTSAHYVIDCEICGIYHITHGLIRDLETNSSINNFLVNCISENIRAQSEGVTPYWADLRTPRQIKGVPKDGMVKYLEDYRELPIVHADKPRVLLKILANKLNKKKPFEGVYITKKEMLSAKILDTTELDSWLHVLVDDGLIHIVSGAPVGTDAISKLYCMRAKGWEKVKELFASVGSRKAFIAMWFKHPQRKTIQEAIEQACSDTGWEGFTIDQREFLGGITDEIIAKINESRFIIAEFTGNRRGVYYEAGYAEGRGIPVIYVVKKGKDLKSVHFDIKHLNYITWSNPDELKQKLVNRIGALINK